MTENAFTAGQGVPGRLVAGDFWTWRADGMAPAYPSDTYSLAYSFAPKAGGTSISTPATADSDGWLVTAAGATTTALAAGPYAWALIATRLSDSATATVVCGVVQIAAAATTGGDTRTTARRHLDAINAVLDGRITKDVESYSIEGRALTRVPLEILTTLRAKYMSEVQAEERLAAGKSSGPRVRKVAFK